MKRRYGVIFLAIVTSLLTLLLTAYAFSGDPEVWFTDNMDATGTDPNPTEMELALLERIDNAVSTIDAAFYDFNRDSIRDALIAAHNRGVTVRVVADDEARLFNDTYIPYFDALEDAGIPIVDDQREGSIMHNKYFVIDGEVVWTGSTNMSDNGFTKNHNNSIVFTSTALADIYLYDYEQMWAGDFSTAKTASLTTTLDYNGIPLEIYFSPKDDALDELISEVDSAETSIEFAIFFLTADPLRDALIAAHNRGVQIRGLWDLLGAASPYSDDEALCAAGIPIKIEDTIGKMHNKFMVIDAAGAQPRVVTGSMNWTTSGDASNDENTLIVHDGVAAGRYATAFAAMWDDLAPDTKCDTGISASAYIYLPLITDDSTGPAPADIRLVTIAYNPPGDDVEGEYVEILNRGGMEQTMTNWTLSDEAGNTYTFPLFSLLPSNSVKVWVKAGTDTSTDLYWGRGSAVWNNDGDTAFLRDETGQEVDTCSYAGGGEAETCLLVAPDSP